MMFSIVRAATVAVLFVAAITAAAAAALITRAHATRSAADRKVEKRLVGSWRLVSAVLKDAAGRAISYPWGAHPAGKLTYTTSRNVWALVAKPNAPKVNVADALWYTGTFDVHSRTGTVVHHVQYSNLPAYERTDLVRRYRFAGSGLTLTVSGNPSLVITWTRSG
jgi:Lipocalin-like domain